MRKWFLVMISMVALLLMLGITSFADGVEYSVTQYTIDADIQTNGSVNFTEYLSYKFDGKANGVYRDIDYINPKDMLHSASSIDKITVFEGSLTDDDMIEYKRGEGHNGMTGVYSIAKTDNGIRLKIYSSANNQEKRFIIQYTLNNAVVKYNDTADFYWNFIGKGWSVPLSNVSIVVTIPENSNHLRLFSHGPLSGNNSIVDTKTIQYTNGKLDPGNNVSIRMLFPPTMIANNTKFVHEDKLSSILKVEAALAKEANLQRRNSIISEILAVTWPILSLIIFIILYNLYGKNKKTYYDTMTEPPGDYGPAFTQYILYYKSIGPNGITAEIMNLVKRKIITLEELLPDTKNKKSKTDYRIKVTNKNINYRYKHEEFLVNWFINTIGNGESVTFQEIKKYSGKHSSKFNHDLGEFKKLIKTEAETRNLIYLKTPAYKAALIFFIFSVISGIYLGISDKMYSFLVSGLISSSFLFFFSILIKKDTPELALEREKWMSYKRYLKSITYEATDNNRPLSYWEEALLYAIVFGYYRNAIKRIKLNYHYNAFSDPDLTFLHTENGGIDSFSNSITSSIANFSSTTGLSSGGSSASSGAGGGGGGGGAF